MMPPALATKSGAHTCRGRRAGPRSRSAASWLFAAPRDHAAVQDRARCRRRARRPARTGASTSTSAVRALSGVRPGGAEPRSASARLPSSRSATTSEGARLRAPAARACRRERGRGRRPRRCDPASDALAEGALAGDLPSRHWTPSAVHGLGSPGCRVSTGEAGRRGRSPSAITAMSRVGGPDVLRGHVGAAERGDGVAEVPAARRGESSPAGVAWPAGEHDHALAAAEREPRDGGLERHRARPGAARRGPRRASRRRSTSGSPRATGRARSSGRRRFV